MSCRKCESSNERSFKSEMTVVFRDLEHVDQAPVYICQDISVCLDCGHIELSLPPEKLEQLKPEGRGRLRGAPPARVAPANRNFE